MEHLVAICPGCDRPVWAKQFARILGFTLKSKGAGKLGFVARSRAPGQGRGWIVVRGVATVADVLREGGQPAVEQLRLFARQTFSRLWAFGLLDADDVAQVTSIRRATGPLNQKVPTVTRIEWSDGYVPGRRVASASQRSQLANSLRRESSQPLDVRPATTTARPFRLSSTDESALNMDPATTTSLRFKP